LVAISSQARGQAGSKSIEEPHPLRLSHDGRPRLLIPFDPRTQPFYRLLDASPGQGAAGQDATVADAGALLALEDLADQALLDADDLDAILAILLVGEDEQGHALGVLVLEDVLEDEAALAEAKAAAEELEKAKKAAEEQAAAAAAEAERLKPKPEEVKLPIKFKDAVGRKFSFPWHLCKTWKGMEELIKQAFLHVDVIGPHVHDGHYDLVGPDGEITVDSMTL